MIISSLASYCSARSELSSTSVASAKPTWARFSVPPKITSSIFWPRREREFCSPMTQRMASEIFDLPLPLGPTIAVMSCPKVTTVLSGKDLKPCSSSCFRYIDYCSYYIYNKLFYQILCKKARQKRSFCQICRAFRPKKQKSPRHRPKALFFYFTSPKSFWIAWAAADCSARFLLVPLPSPTHSPLRSTRTENCLLWSGPLSPTSS